MDRCASCQASTSWEACLWQTKTTTKKTAPRYCRNFTHSSYVFTSSLFFPLLQVWLSFHLQATACGEAFKIGKTRGTNSVTFIGSIVKVPNPFPGCFLPQMDDTRFPEESIRPLFDGPPGFSWNLLNLFCLRVSLQMSVPTSTIHAFRSHKTYNMDNTPSWGHAGAIDSRPVDC